MGIIILVSFVVTVIIVGCVLIKDWNKEINWVSEKSDSLVNNLLDNKKPTKVEKYVYVSCEGLIKWSLFFKEYKLIIVKRDYIPFEQVESFEFECYNVSGKKEFLCKENSEIKIFKPETYDKLKRLYLNLKETEQKK
jgi:hypothetical protein